MKKIVAILTVLAMLLCTALAEEIVPAEGSPAAAMPVVPGNRLGFELLSELYSEGENRVLSPLSLRLALAMAAVGAQGETLEQLLAALEAQDLDSLSALLPEEIKSANALFVAPELVLNDAYAQQMNEAFAAEWFALEGDVAAQVNDWAAEKTDGMIEELLKDAPAQDAGLILLNAIAMDADWTEAFDPNDSYEQTFHAPQGDVQVEMMHQSATFDYAEKDGLQIIRLPYQNGKLAMWIVLPDAEADASMALSGALEMLAAEGMFYLTGDVAPTEVDLSLPKLDVTDENSLADALQALGVEAAFSDAADFSHISETPLYIADVLQQVRVQIDEEGTRAAAATAAVMMAMAMPVEMEKVEMCVDRPFAFVIADGESGSVCFAGAIENPVA